MRSLNGQPIIHICAGCVIRHAVVKEPKIMPLPVSGVTRCDVCEVLGPKNVPQSVFDVKGFGGVRPESYHNGELIVFENEDLA